MLPKGYNYMIFEKTVWDKKIPITTTFNLHHMINMLLEKKYACIVVQGSAWAENMLNITCLVSLIATKNLSMEIDIGVALELLLCFSYYL